MKPNDHPSPIAFRTDDAERLIAHLNTLRGYLNDAEIPSQSRFAVGNALYGLALMRVSTDQTTPLEQLDDTRKRVLSAGVEGLKTCYEITNEVDPADALNHVYYASQLVRANRDPALARQRLAERGWPIDERTIADAQKLFYQ